MEEKFIRFFYQHNPQTRRSFKLRSNDVNSQRVGLFSNLGRPIIYDAQTQRFCRADAHGRFTITFHEDQKYQVFDESEIDPANPPPLQPQEPAGVASPKFARPLHFRGVKFARPVQLVASPPLELPPPSQGKTKPPKTIKASNNQESSNKASSQIPVTNNAASASGSSAFPQPHAAATGASASARDTGALPASAKPAGRKGKLVREKSQEQVEAEESFLPDHLRSTAKPKGKSKSHGRKK
jgi:hypothetical protein